MQLDIPFLRTRKRPGPEGNFEGCSRHYAPALERFVILVSDHTNRSQRVNDANKVPAICKKGKKPRELLHYISTPRELPSKDDLTLGAKRDQSVMRQWATGHGKAMQCTTKDSAGTLRLNMSQKNYALERELSWNTMTRKELRRRPRSFYWSWQKCDFKFAVKINSHSLWVSFTYLLVA